MTIEQVDSLISRIKIYRPFFCSNQDKNSIMKLKKDWYKVLVNYDNEDVNKALEEFVHVDDKNTIPAVMTLVSGLTKISNKDISDIFIECRICRHKIRLKNYDPHYEKCSSIDYLSRMAFKYSNINLDVDKLYQLDDENFEKFYWSCCRSLLTKIDNEAELYFLKNAIEVHDGKKPLMSFHEVLKSMNRKKG